MTIHSAKGLEYPVVFLVGMEEGVFPHIRSIGEPDQLEEERRLAYVAITRARQRLYVSHAWTGVLFGSSQYNPPSRFLDEIPSRAVRGDRHVPSQRSGSAFGPRPRLRRWRRRRPRRGCRPVGTGGGGVGRPQPIWSTPRCGPGPRPRPSGPTGAAGLGPAGGRRRATTRLGRGRRAGHQRARGTRPRPSSASRRWARSTCCWRGRRCSGSDRALSALAAGGRWRVLSPDSPRSSLRFAPLRPWAPVRRHPPDDRSGASAA